MNLRKINNKKMEKVLSFLFLLLLFSCKGEPFKKEGGSASSNEAIKINKQDNDNLSSKISENCYDYLTELVRSSNFPFSQWKIDRHKVNLLIDEENDDIISTKLFFDTEGDGTIGWVEYHKRDGKLFNTSANLDNPVELKYDSKWKNLFDSCLPNQGNPNTYTMKDTLEKIYEDSDELVLPNKYDYDIIVEEKGFKSIDKEYYSLFPIRNQDNYKIAKLPIINDNVKPVILITYNEIGQATWYLFVLNNEYKPISNVILYTSEEVDGGKSKSTTYNISKDYKISINKLYNDKIISKKEYSISNEGFIK